MNMNLVIIIMMMFMLMLNLVNDVEIEHVVDLDNPLPKNKRYDKRDFIAMKHGKEREPWVQKPMHFPPKA